MALDHAGNVEELYELQDELGSGQFSTVRRCLERSSGTYFAAKFIKIRRKKGSRLGLDRKVACQEVDILQQLRHPHIMKLHDLFVCQLQMVLVLELVQGGELFDSVAEKESLSEPQASDFLIQILDALAYMHSLNIAHFDLKEHLEDLTIYREYLFHLDSALDIFHDSRKHLWIALVEEVSCLGIPFTLEGTSLDQNQSQAKHQITPEIIMLQQKDIKPNIKITGFEMAQSIEKNTCLQKRCGVPEYIAPEVIKLEPLSVVADMWSVGVITYVLLSGISPFQGETESETINNVTKGIFKYEDTHFSSTSAIAKDFINQLLVINPKERMTSAQALLHPWIKERNRDSCLINMDNFRRFNVERKKKQSYHMIASCNNLCKMSLFCVHTKENEDLRACESDQEDSPVPPASLLRRRRSSYS